MGRLRDRETGRSRGRESRIQKSESRSQNPEHEQTDISCGNAGFHNVIKRQPESSRSPATRSSSSGFLLLIFILRERWFALCNQKCEYDSSRRLVGGFKVSLFAILRERRFAQCIHKAIQEFPQPSNRI